MSVAFLRPYRSSSILTLFLHPPPHSPPTATSTASLLPVPKPRSPRQIQIRTADRSHANQFGHDELVVGGCVRRPRERWRDCQGLRWVRREERKIDRRPAANEDINFGVVAGLGEHVTSIATPAPAP